MRWKGKNLRPYGPIIQKSQKFNYEQALKPLGEKLHEVPVWNTIIANVYKEPEVGPEPTPSITPSNTPTPSVTAEPTSTPTQTPTASITPTPSITAQPTSTPTNTPSPTGTPIISPSYTPTNTPTPSRPACKSIRITVLSGPASASGTRCNGTSFNVTGANAGYTNTVCFDNTPTLQLYFFSGSWDAQDLGTCS